MLLDPTKSSRVSAASTAPNLERIVNVLPSHPNAAAFQYLDVEVDINYTPESDVNLQQTVDVSTSDHIPCPLQDLAMLYSNADDFCQNLPIYSKEQVHQIE